MENRTKQWRVYLLRCSDGSLYCGCTNDLAKRLAAHSSGKGAKYTRARLPVTLAWSERCEDRSEAMKAEIRIKRLSKADKESLLVRQGLSYTNIPGKR